MVRLTNNNRDYDPANMLEDKGALGKMVTTYIAQDDMDDKAQKIHKMKDELRANIVDLCTSLEIKKESSRSIIYLKINNKVTFEEGAKVFCWPAGNSENQAVFLNDKLMNNLISLGSVEDAKINSYLSILGQFTCEGEKQELRFTLKLPLIGAPSDRESLLLNFIINDKARFLKYVLMLMGRLTGVTPISGQPSGQVKGHGKENHPERKPIESLTTEDLLRCYAYHPERFKQIRTFMKDFNVGNFDNAAIPEEFLQVWKIFEEAVGKNDAI